MNASDKIKYYSIVSKVNNGLLDDIEPEEYLWLQNNPHVLRNMNLTRKRKEFFKNVREFVVP